MEIGDWVVLPSKVNRTIHFGEVKGEYVYDKSLGSPYYHYRDIEWFAMDIPRENFDQDILYSLGAFMTVFKIHKNDAENRIKAMYENDWKVMKGSTSIEVISDDDVDGTQIDLNEFI